MKQNVSVPSAFRRLRILIAEDNEVNQKVIRIILERNGCEFVMVSNGLEVIERFANGDFNIVFMDCQMPELDGLEASRRIRAFEVNKNKSRCAIIAMTANAMTGDKDKCLAAGMDDFLSKPFKSQDLVELMKQWSLKIKDLNLKHEEVNGKQSI